MKRKASSPAPRRRAASLDSTNPAREVARGVRAIIATHLEEGCEQAWSDLGHLFGVEPLFPQTDPSTAAARLGIRAVIDDLSAELTTLALAAVLLPPVTRRLGPSSRPTPSKVIALRTHRNGNGRAPVP